MTLLFCVGGVFIPGHRRKTLNNDCFLVNKEGIIISTFPSSIKSPCTTLKVNGGHFLYVAAWISIKFLQKLCLSSLHNQVFLLNRQPHRTHLNHQHHMNHQCMVSPPSSPESPAATSGLPSALEPVLHGAIVGGSCGAGADCVGDDGDMLLCDKCDFFFHFTCQGFSSSPFADHEEQMNSQFLLFKMQENFSVKKTSFVGEK